MTRQRRHKTPQPRYQAVKLLEPLGQDVWASRLAIRLGVNRATIQRWRNPKTTLNQWDADRYAVRLGKHPSEIWTNWFDYPC